MLCVHTGVAYTSECFPCRPGWFSPAPGSSSCEPCPSNTFSIKDAAFCTPCPEHHYSRTYTRNNSRLNNRTIRAVVLLLASLYPVINLYLLPVNVDNQTCFPIPFWFCMFLSLNRCVLHHHTSFSRPTPLSDEGWAECKVRPPCSEKDYFQIHTACDSEGKVSGVHTFYISHTRTHTHTQTSSHFSLHKDRRTDIERLEQFVNVQTFNPNPNPHDSFQV